MIRYENRIPAADYLRLRAAAGWKPISPKQAENAVNRCFFSVCVRDEDRVIGMLRLLWNGDYCAYITDVIVEEAWRGRGIATEMMRLAEERLRAKMEEGFTVKLFLMAAPGRESFYERFGFARRPNEHAGAAMDRWIEK